MPSSKCLTASLATVGLVWAAVTAADNIGGDGGGFTSFAITFNASDFNNNSTNPPAAVYVGTQNNDLPTGLTKSFHFAIASGVNVINASIINLDSQNDWVIGSTTASVQPATASSGAGFKPPPKKRSSTVDIPMNLPTNNDNNGVPSGAVVLTDTSVITNNYAKDALCFQIYWNKTGNVVGKSFSRMFAFVANDTDASAILPSFTSTAPALSETSSTVSNSPQTSGSVPMTAAPGTTPSSTSSASAAGPSSGSSSSSSSGISHGAIAGIVIGVVAGIAIIAGLLWFLGRRVRGRRSPAASASNRLHTGAGVVPADDFMGEKDVFVNGAVPRTATGGDDGPHSPYSDEDATATASAGAAGSAAVRSAPAANNGAATVPGQSPAARAAVPAVAAARAAHSTPSASPVASAAQTAGSGGAAPAPGTSAQPAIPGQVAALIEDHMTPEDVARLEAEERELDADIENAIRNRAAAGSR